MEAVVKQRQLEIEASIQREEAALGKLIKNKIKTKENFN